MGHLRGLLRHYDRRSLGGPTARDGDGTTRVDFVFGDADPAPGVALEITSITDGPVIALGRELERLEVELDRVAVDEELGFWSLGVRVGSAVRVLRPMLLDLLRSQKGRSDVMAQYSAADAPDDLAVDDLALLARVLEAGFYNGMRSSEGHGVSMFPPVSSSNSDGGFGTLLRHAVADNAVKLGEARPAETHLYVDIGLSVANDPRRTPAPTLPPEVDVLWVNLGYWNSKYDYRTWRVRGGDARWELLDHPLGQGPHLASTDQ